MERREADTLEDDTMKTITETTYAEILMAHPLYPRVKAHRDRAGLSAPTEAEAALMFAGGVEALLNVADMVNPL
jgi:hypothetical protein